MPRSAGAKAYIDGVNEACGSVLEKVIVPAYVPTVLPTLSTAVTVTSNGVPAVPDDGAADEVIECSRRELAHGEVAERGDSSASGAGGGARTGGKRLPSRSRIQRHVEVVIGAQSISAAPKFTVAL